MAQQRQLKLRDGKLAAIPDDWNDDQIAAFITEYDKSLTPATPAGVAPLPKPPTGVLGTVQRGLDAAAKGIRSIPLPTADPADINARVGQWAVEQARELPASLLEMAAHPIDNAPMIGATLATLPLGPAAGVGRGMVRALGGSLAGSAARTGYEAGVEGTKPTVDTALRAGVEAVRDTATEGLARFFPWMRQRAIKDEAHALAGFVNPEDLLTRRTAEGELIPTLPGVGGRTVTPALEDLAAQSLDEVPGIRAFGRKDSAQKLSDRVSGLRSQKTAALDRTAGAEIPASAATRSASDLMENIERSGTSPRAQLKTVEGTVKQFLDRPVLERTGEGTLERGRMGLPSPVSIDGSGDVARQSFTPQRVDELLQSLGRDIADAGAFGKNVPQVKIETWKAIRGDLKDALNELAPELEDLNLQMSRTIPLAEAFGSATYPKGPKIGLGELGAFSGNRLSAGVAATRRPKVLSALARLQNAISKIPAGATPRELTTLLRVLQQTYLPTAPSHERALPTPPKR